MKINVSHYFLLFFLVLSLFVIGLSLTFRYWEAMILPLFFGGIILITSAVELGREFKKSRTKTRIAKVETPQQEVQRGLQVRQFSSALCWIIVFSLGTYLLGFLIAIPLFSIVYLRAYGRGWFVAICFAAIMTALIYGMFGLFLRTVLYRGLIWELMFR